MMTHKYMYKNEQIRIQNPGRLSNPELKEVLSVIKETFLL